MNETETSATRKEILDFLDNNRSDLFSLKEIANGLNKKIKQEINNVKKLLLKLLATRSVLQPMRNQTNVLYL